MPRNGGWRHQPTNRPKGRHEPRGLREEYFRYVTRGRYKGTWQLREEGHEPVTQTELRALRHQGYTEHEKLNLGIRLNIYDAAKSYRVASGQTGVRVRDILKQAEFIDAWHTFRGAGRKGGKKTFFDDKMAAAETLGWAPPRKEAIERLRNISP